MRRRKAARSLGQSSRTSLLCYIFIHSYLAQQDQQVVELNQSSHTLREATPPMLSRSQTDLVVFSPPVRAHRSLESSLRPSSFTSFLLFTTNKPSARHGKLLVISRYSATPTQDLITRFRQPCPSYAPRSTLSRLFLLLPLPPTNLPSPHSPTTIHNPHSPLPLAKISPNPRLQPRRPRQPRPG